MTRIATDFKSVMTRDGRGRWVRLPRTSAREILGKKSSDSANKKPPHHNGRGLCFGSNGHEIFRTQFSEDPPRGRTENLLIKSKLLFVHRHVQQPTIGTILRLTAKTVPSRQK